MHPHLFKKNPNQSCPKKKINKYENMLETKKKQTKGKLDLFKKM